MAWYSVAFYRLLPASPHLLQEQNQCFDVPDCLESLAIAIGGGSALDGMMRVAAASDMAIGSCPILP